MRYLCGLCNKGFAKYPVLEVHMRSHTGETPFCCHICDRWFKHQASLNTHKAVQHGIIEERIMNNCHKCEDCEKKFRSDKAFLSHKSVDHKYKCWYLRCQKCFPNSDALKLHFIQEHGTRNAFRCPVCNSPYGTYGACQVHIRKEHPYENFPYSPRCTYPFYCPRCRHGFQLKRTFNWHKCPKESSLLRYKCEWCPQRFATLKGYQLHKFKRHRLLLEREDRARLRDLLQKNRPFICFFCNKGFVCKYNLHNHLRSHTRERPYACKSCGKDFATTSSLSVHKKNVHRTGRKRCPLCRVKCRNTPLLIVHLKRAHNLSPFRTKWKPCHVCGVTFKERQLLNNHLKKAHGNLI